MKKEKEKYLSGLSSKTNMSYEQYLKGGLGIINENLSVRVYKIGTKKDYPLFERGKDVRVQIYWKTESKYEFLVEKTFFYQSNRNKEDRSWMRNHADTHLEIFYNAVQDGKKKKSITPGHTQKAFDKLVSNSK
jgi:hypothetical protein